MGTLRKINIGGGDQAIFKVVETMLRLARVDSSSPEIKKIAAKVKAKCKDNNCLAYEGFYAIAKLIDYRYDHENIKNFPIKTSDPNNVEFIIRPKFYAAGLYKHGDCDDMSTFLGSLFLALGLRTNFVIVAHNSDAYSHVYVEALCTMDSGETGWVPFDLVKEDRGQKVPGWAISSIRLKAFEL